MEHGLVPIDPKMLALMHGTFQLDGKLQPFAKEIMLIECHVAGTSHRDLSAVEDGLAPAQFLALLREPENAYDELAIKVMDEAGHQLGYVPRAKNEALARLMDAGKLLFGRIDAVKHLNHWLKINVRIFMRDW